MTPPLYLDYNSPIGVIRISGDEEFIHEIAFVHKYEYAQSDAANILNDCKRQLDEYFSGKRKSFSLPLQFNGTVFQRKIWSLLQQIPYGKTISYLELAVRAGNKKLTRAAGLANGSNKLAIVIPCHRVIGSNGKLVGYAGGLWRKKWLLDFENRDAQPQLFAEVKISESHEKV